MCVLFLHILLFRVEFFVSCIVYNKCVLNKMNACNIDLYSIYIVFL